MTDRFDHTVERIAPARAPSVRADVAVPLLQSLVTGVLIGSPFGLVVYAVGGHELVIPALILLATGAMWVWRLMRTDETLWATETRLGMDLDGDGDVGAPTERVIGLNPFRGQQAREEADRDVQNSRLAGFLRDAFTDTSMAFLQGRGYDRDAEIVPWRDNLIAGGWASWRSANRRHGWAFAVDVSLEELLSSLVAMS